MRREIEAEPDGIVFSTGIAEPPVSGVDPFLSELTLKAMPGKFERRWHTFGLANEKRGP